jgi:hypothetical protein
MSNSQRRSFVTFPFSLSPSGRSRALLSHELIVQTICVKSLQDLALFFNAFIMLEFGIRHFTCQHSLGCHFDEVIQGSELCRGTLYAFVGHILGYVACVVWA